MKQKPLLAYIKEYLSDGKPKKLINIVDDVHSMGWKSSPSSRYIHFYHELREHPELFKRVAPGYYQLNKNVKCVKFDRDDVLEFISNILKRKPNQSVAQIWRSLQTRGVAISYKATYQKLQSDLFVKVGFGRYSLQK